MMRGRSHMMRGPQMRMRIDFFLLRFESAVGNPMVKERDEKHREKSGREHAADHTGTYCVTRTGARAA